MNTAVTAASIAFGAAGLGLCALAAVVARRPARPGRSAFVLLCGLFAVAAFAAAGGLVAGLGVTDAGWHLLIRGPTILAIGPWIVFVIQFTGRHRALTGWRTTALLAPVAAFAVAWTGDVLLGEVEPEIAVASSVVAFESAAADAIAVSVLLLGIVVYAMAFTGLAILLQASAVNDRFPSIAAVVLSVAVLAPVLLAFVGWTIRDVAGQSLVLGTYVGGLAICTGGLWAAVGRFAAFDSSAVAVGTLAQEALLAELEDCIVIVDDHGRIVGLNDAARDTLGVTTSEATGNPVDHVCGGPIGAFENDAVVTIETVDGPRRFDLRLTELDDGRTHLGTILSFRDVTTRELREQRIQILNRVLRHNLRNKLALVRGNAERVASDDAPETAGEEIRTATDELLALGEKARAIESVLSDQHSSADTARVDVVVESVVEEVRADHDDLAVDVSIREPVVVRAGGAALEYLIDELVDNAIVHNDAATPRLEVTVDGDEEGGEVVVADNGPGIPRSERVAIRRGEESPLVHGSGLGLWGVRWTATLLGGELRFADNEPRGTIVRVTLPRANVPLEDVKDGTKTGSGEDLLGSADD